MKLLRSTLVTGVLLVSAFGLGATHPGAVHVVMTDHFIRRTQPSSSN